MYDFNLLSGFIHPSGDLFVYLHHNEQKIKNINSCVLQKKRFFLLLIDNINMIIEKSPHFSFVD